MIFTILGTRLSNLTQNFQIAPLEVLHFCRLYGSGILEHIDEDTTKLVHPLTIKLNLIKNHFGYQQLNLVIIHWFAKQLGFSKLYQFQWPGNCSVLSTMANKEGQEGGDNHP